MLKIYHVKGTRAIRVIWLCEELGVPYEVEVVSFSPDFRQSAEWRAKNPTGKVPAMDDGDFTMFESGAMVDYVLEKYGDGRLVGEPGSQTSALIRQWSWFSEATFARPLGEIVNHRRIAPKDGEVEFVIEDSKERGRICLAAIEDVVKNADYLVDNTFSVADIMNGYTLILAETFGVLDDDFPATQAYFARLGERPGFQVATAAG